LFCSAIPFFSFGERERGIGEGTAERGNTLIVAFSPRLPISVHLMTPDSANATSDEPHRDYAIVNGPAEAVRFATVAIRSMYAISV